MLIRPGSPAARISEPTDSRLGCRSIGIESARGGLFRPAVAVSLTIFALILARPLIGDTLARAEKAVPAAGEKLPAPTPPPADAIASSEAEMKPYTQPIMHTDTEIELVPIPGGTFKMGSPDDEEGRGDDEGPVHEVQVGPFWMGKFEITWDQYDIWNEKIDIIRRDLAGIKPTPADVIVDGMTRPTEPYTDMSFGFGRGRYPAICMTQHAAQTYCQWLSAKTGFYYRLPTEAEWEYACRAGTTTAFSFGDDPSELDKYAVFIDNSDDQYEEVGTREPNPWGLYDMHGNVSEWVLDQLDPEAYGRRVGAVAVDPLEVPKTLHPRVVRGGGWDNDAEQLRSAARIGSHEDWKQQDPQIPQSIWYFTDALSVGFRIVRPLNEPSDEEKETKWEKNAPPQIDE
jgi:formylglycine-generating enzyme required for sulfatase activity